MLTDIRAFRQTFLDGLLAAFPGRVCFAGLQGSYRRGEADEESDIDLVVVLDRVSTADLDRYRALVRALPNGDRACGFLCGREPLARWPRSDLLTLALDTEGWYGSLEALLPDFSDGDVDGAVRLAASGLYHMAVHGYLYGPDPAAALGELRKSVYFLLRVRVYRDTGRWRLTGPELLSDLTEEERALSVLCGGRGPAENAGALYPLLLDWCSRLL